MTLRELVYTKDLSQETKFRLLRAIDSKTWVENVVDLIVELSQELETLQKMAVFDKATVGGIEIPVDPENV
jgi:hypothetical protein